MLRYATGVRGQREAGRAVRRRSAAVARVKSAGRVRPGRNRGQRRTAKVQHPSRSAGCRCWSSPHSSRRSSTMAAHPQKSSFSTAYCSVGYIDVPLPSTATPKVFPSGLRSDDLAYSRPKSRSLQHPAIEIIGEVHVAFHPPLSLWARTARVGNRALRIACPKSRSPSAPGCGIGDIDIALVSTATA